MPAPFKRLPTKPLGQCFVENNTMYAGYLVVTANDTKQRAALVELRDYKGNLKQAYENAKLFAAAPAMRDALDAEDFFTTKGYHRSSVWEFAQQDTDHPAWAAFHNGGAAEVRRYIAQLRRDALAATHMMGIFLEEKEKK